MQYKYILLSLCLTVLFGACGVRESWPPKTTGPNLPVRCCDINKGDKDKSIIGYALVDTSTVNWLVSIWMKGACVYTPPFYDPYDMDTLPPPPPNRHALSRYWLRVDDGGDGYWSAMLDLDDGVVEDFFINGP